MHIQGTLLLCLHFTEKVEAMRFLQVPVVCAVPSLPLLWVNFFLLSPSADLPLMLLHSCSSSSPFCLVSLTLLAPSSCHSISLLPISSPLKRFHFCLHFPSPSHVYSIPPLSRSLSPLPFILCPFLYCTTYFWFFPKLLILTHASHKPTSSHYYSRDFHNPKSSDKS